MREPQIDVLLQKEKKAFALFVWPLGPLRSGVEMPKNRSFITSCGSQNLFQYWDNQVQMFVKLSLNANSD